MRRVYSLLLVLLIASSASAHDGGLTSIAESIRVQSGAPAVGIARLSSGEALIGVSGSRAAGNTTPVQPDDVWHVGSNTKSMTATLVARLAEKGVVRWTDTIGDTLGTALTDIHPGYAAMTYVELLSHRAGVPSNIGGGDLWRMTRILREDRPVGEQRLVYARMVLRKRPAVRDGRFRYSNGGYIIVGAMLETTTGMAWEDLMRQEVFEPMGLASAGFGPPGTAAEGADETEVKPDQPWGHRSRFGRLRPVPPGPGADNPAFLGPAGTAHMSLEDLLTYLSYHLAGSRGEESVYLSPASWEMLHGAFEPSGYALGWMISEGSVGHNGSNLMWYVTMTFSPEENVASVAAFNEGRIGRLTRHTQEAFDALGEVE